jgi:hypothetical protein
LPYKLVSMSLNNMMMEVEQETLTSDYKNIDGVMVPHSVTIIQDGEEFMNSTVSDVKINTGLEDSLFRKGS